MESYRRLLLANKAWILEKTRLKPSYFEELAKEQSPEFFWIGCSDSRVPAEEVTGTGPGEIFTHRNIGNLILPSDRNLSSAIEYAVKFLKVRHIIVCGHYGCGGVRAALQPMESVPLVTEWISPLVELRQQHADELSQIKDPLALANRLVELNVLKQVTNLASSPTIRTSWATGTLPMIHGWVFEMTTGKLRSLNTVGPT
jgi:carbonic anhydrase